MNIDKKKTTIILSVITVMTLVILLVGATYAYFQAQGGVGASTDVRVTTYTSDLLTFTTGDDIAIYADQSNFADGLGNKSSETFAKAHLLANSKTNTATANYYVYLYIPDNSFVYTQEDNTPELLLQVTNPDGTEVTSIDGLDYKTVTDGKGQTVKGFDITTKLGMLTLVNNHEIVATPETQETWNFNVVFVNLGANQSENMGKDFRSQLIITKDNYDDYTPAMVHTISTNIEDSNLTVSVNASEGTEGISKYYYAIKENNATAMNTSKVTRLSNTLAVNDLEYIELDSSSYTFSNINSSSNYEIYTYVIDNRKTTSNIYNTKVNNDLVVPPSISKVEVTDKTQTSLTVSVTANEGTNAINKYYYSIDNGKTYVETTNSTYTFNNLVNGITYNIKIKVSDTNNNYSYEFELNEKIVIPTLASWVKSQYNGIQGENGIYYHTSSLENGARDNSYRYAGANPNNFVCFGSSATVCPNNYLYRIIGVFGNQVKLIKWDYANGNLLGTDGDYVSGTYSSSDYSTYKGSKTTINRYYWNSGGTNTWSESKLNTENLNTYFIDIIGTVWANKIAQTTWKVGGNTWDNIYNATAANAYTNEITNPDTTIESTYPAKIALMYTSDYGFAASPSAWTSNLGSYDSSSITSVNWMYMGLPEWTVVRSMDFNDKTFMVLYTGSVNEGYVRINSMWAVRPVFYLESFVTYDSGLGTKTDPIRIS